MILNHTVFRSCSSCQFLLIPVYTRANYNHLTTPLNCDLVKMLQLAYNNKIVLHNADIHLPYILNIKELSPDYYLIHNGKLLNPNCIPDNGIIHMVPRLSGGKGGFGSMLRAIGAQIEKTTNREACRDLSGRRLRDINEEKRLKAWIDKQAVQTDDSEEKKQKKLQKLQQLEHVPKHEFKDDVYDKERSELPDRLEDAVTQGLKAVAAPSSSSKSVLKRKADSKEVGPKKKKSSVLWVEEGLELTSDDSSSELDSDAESNEMVAKRN